MSLLLPFQRSGNNILGKVLVELREQIDLHRLAKLFYGGVSLDAEEGGCSNAFLEGFELARSGVVESRVTGIRCLAGFLPVEAISKAAVAQEEKRMAGDLVGSTFRQYREFHFEFSDANASFDSLLDGFGVGGIAVLLPIGGEVFVFRNPAVAFAQKPYKERREITAAVNLLETDFNGGAVLRF